jgi:superfamily I DNA and RNA helicase
MDFIPALPSYGTDYSAKTVWGWFEAALKAFDGISYYKHPIVGSASGSRPDFTILAQPYQPIVVSCIRLRLEDIVAVDEQEWVINDGGSQKSVDSPLLEMDDFLVGLQQRFDKERAIRRQFSVVPVIAFPIIAAADFKAKFNLEFPNSIWRAEDAASVLIQHSKQLSQREWRTAKSVMQSATPLNKISGPLPKTAKRLGEAIRLLESDIANLDLEQEKVATQIPPGPQRIRGLAGTGKTVLLAMKAANIHRQLPDKKILFTFNTQSLYNQTKTLISKFYRHFSDVDPDWTRVHIRHAWGGRARPGVYYDVCARQGLNCLDFRLAKAADPEIPFRACCAGALQGRVEPEYDYVLVDEAQDFPREFFQLLYKLTGDEHAIFWAYDELQSLASVEIPNTTELFGRDAAGNALVSLEGDYPGGIEKDFVLHKSYRCPLKVLVLAHAIGLGIHSPNGPVQMLGRPESWRSIGYEVEAERFVQGEEVVVSRPVDNSPNPLETIYSGDDPLIKTTVFNDRSAELDWVSLSCGAATELWWPQPAEPHLCLYRDP